MSWQVKIRLAKDVVMLKKKRKKIKKKNERDS